MNKNFVVRTHKTGGKWASEQTDGGNPFRRNANFNVIIKLTGTSYEVYVDDVYFCEYQFAFRADKIGFIKVHGDVQLKRIGAGDESTRLYLRRTIAVGDRVRSEISPRNFSQIMFIELDNHRKGLARIQGKRQENFTFQCNHCNEIPLDLFYGNQETFIIEMEFLSDAVIRIYNGAKYLKTVALENKHEIEQANLIRMDSINPIECYRIP
ncbi:uncharacterized protein LOC131940169 [Physella acuta]|uniref:uncharacterized protein LOC131940169 n=1 Tax=Physella acuta TaxID=109671 RepID=UPI0027DE1441|nr:uncharacterized protein LOC131940169 [Physella acuta]